MRRDHILFGLVCALMFLFPRLPATLILPDAPGKSTISLATGGLLLWAILRPRYLLRFPGTIYRRAYFMFWFASFALGSTLLSFSATNVIYAIQYFLVSFVSAMLFSNYAARAAAEGELHTIVKILISIGTLFALGIIVSYWTGPIYPQQVLEYGRYWARVRLSQGVGFSVNPNSAGGFIIFFLAILILLYRSSRAKRIALAAVLTLALFLTISRAAIMGCFIGLGLVLVSLVVNGLPSPTGSRAMKRKLWRAAAGMVFVGLCLALLASYNADLRESLLEGFGFGQQSLMVMEQGRMSAWQRGLLLWADGSPVDMLIGHGYRGSVVQENLYFATPHNMFIAVLGDFGILGLLLLLVPWFLIMIKAASRISWKNPYALCSLWVLGAFLVMNQTDTFLYGIEYMFLMTLVSILMAVALPAASALKTGAANGRGGLEEKRFKPALPVFSPGESASSPSGRYAASLLAPAGPPPKASP